MLFGIIIVVIVILLAYLLNKSKISNVIHEAEQKVEETIEKVERVVAPIVNEVKIELSNKVPETEKKAPVGTVITSKSKKAGKPGPKPGNKAGMNAVQKQSNNKIKQNTKK